MSGQIGGSGSLASRVVWVFLAACIAVAVMREFPQEPQALYKDLDGKASKVERFAVGLGKDIEAAGERWESTGVLVDLGTNPPRTEAPTGQQTTPQQTKPKPGKPKPGKPKPGKPKPTKPGKPKPGPADTSVKATATRALNALTVSTTVLSGYDRDQWRHWDNYQRSCWTIREEVLARSADPGTLTVLNAAKRPTNNPAEACEVSGARWTDRFTGQTFTNPSDLDIDHLVPLAEAARTGGQKWPEDKKRDYANSLNPGHLWAVSASANRQKGDKSPAAWKPSHTPTHCTYAAAWISVKSTWGLWVHPNEKTALTSMLATC